MSGTKSLLSARDYACHAVASWGWGHVFVITRHPITADTYRMPALMLVAGVPMVQKHTHSSRIVLIMPSPIAR